MGCLVSMFGILLAVAGFFFHFWPCFSFGIFMIIIGFAMDSSKYQQYR